MGVAGDVALTGGAYGGPCYLSRRCCGLQFAGILEQMSERRSPVMEVGICIRSGKSRSQCTVCCSSYRVSQAVGGVSAVICLSLPVV